MSNRLPEKLAVLRKEYGFTQSDVAQKLNISVTDYMNWENGNKLCTIEQLKVLADMYGVTVDALADNTKEITGKPEKNAETIDIPFMTPHTSVNPMDDTEDYVRPANQNATQELSDGTIRIDMGRFNTRPAPSPDEQPTMTQTFTQSVTIRPKREEPKEEPVTEHPTGGRKRRVIFISAMIALAGILCVLVFALLGSGGGKVGLSQTNRIALGDRYSLYVDKSGQLQVRGIFEPAARFDNVVQVSAYDSHALGLTGNGTVVNSVSDPNTETWKNVVMIAAGRNHSAALKKDGSVYCSGSAEACRVADWKEMEQIYAGDEVTIGIREDGSVAVSGNVPEGISQLENVRTAAVGKNTYAFILRDGTVRVFPSTADIAAETLVWTNMDEISAGDGFVAGILKDGRAVIASTDEALKERVLGWGDLRYIAANGSTVIAVDKNGKMHGAGDNTYNQYDTTEETPAPSETPETILAKPTDITFSETTSNIVIKWNTVEHADYYEVTVNTSPLTKIKSAGNSTSIPSSSLVSGTEYTVTVTAYANDEKKYGTSETASVRYQYNAITIELDPVANITDRVDGKYWCFNWQPVEHADYYLCTLEGQPQVRIDGTEFVVDSSVAGLVSGNNYVIHVQACSEDAKYSPAPDKAVTRLYQRTEYAVTLVFKDETNTEVGRISVNVEPGTYLLSALIQDAMPQNYSLKEDYEITVSSRMEKDVSVITMSPQEEPGGEPHE
ncbi:MAG: helix-turn-helix domain-containing protein [Solobacterium sp.]|nr:helix-turn-helix domain-containing protein [Solobacterium sp.]